MKNGTIPVVMQIIPSLGAGGAEQGCIDVAAELKNSGAEALVISNGGSRLHELQRIGAQHINMKVDSKNPFIMWRNIKKIRKLIQKHQVDIVHARSRAPAWSAWRACEGTNAHYVTTCHAPYKIQNSAKKFYNSAIAKGERVIAISNYVSEYLKKNFRLGDNIIRLIHRGVNVQRFHPSLVTAERLVKLTKEWRIPDGHNVVMLPGRLTRWKGHEDFIKALSLLKRKDMFGIIIGDDQGRTEYRNELHELIKECGMEGAIRIVNHCNDMPTAYMLATVVVSASTEPEGFGRIPIEAQAMGRPTVATAHGGAMETIIPNVTGWHVPPHAPQEMAKAIARALQLNEEERQALSERAIAHVHAHFTKDIMCDKTLDVYAELIRQK